MTGTDEWHLNKTVTIGNMITMVLAIMAMVGSYYTLDKRLALLEHNDGEQDSHIHEFKDEVMKELDDIKGLIMQVHFNQNTGNN